MRTTFDIYICILKYNLKFIDVLVSSDSNLISFKSIKEFLNKNEVIF